MIDAHHHFWQPDRGDYGWMPKDDPVLSRLYGPADMAPALAAAGVDRTILVQAAPTVAETEYLLGIADVTAHVAGVVGWIDFEDPGSLQTLRRLARHPKFKGVRPMIQDIPDDGWMLRGDVQWAFEAIVECDLTFDALGFPRHLTHFHRLFTRYPTMRSVIDHCMKPRIGSASPQDFTIWAEGMSALAETQAFVKLSGLVTEADAGFDASSLRPYANHVFEAFGPDRVMWGSDWPVVRLRCEYGEWCALARDLTADLDAAARDRIFGGTATEFYRLEE